jgi:glutathione S-transferase
MRLSETISLFGKKADEKAVQEFVAKLESKLDVYETILSKQKYLAGDVSSFFILSLIR